MEFLTTGRGIARQDWKTGVMVKLYKIHTRAHETHDACLRNETPKGEDCLLLALAFTLLSSHKVHRLTFSRLRPLSHKEAAVTAWSPSTRSSAEAVWSGCPSWPDRVRLCKAGHVTIVSSYRAHGCQEIVWWSAGCTSPNLSSCESANQSM